MIQASARQHSEQDLFALDRQDGSKHKQQDRHGAVEETRDDSMGKRRQMAAQKRGSSSARSCQEAMYQIATILSPASFFEHKVRSWLFIDAYAAQLEPLTFNRMLLPHRMFTANSQALGPEHLLPACCSSCWTPRS